jgi:hypothetical protein
MFPQSAAAIAVIVAIIVLIWIYYQEFATRAQVRANNARRANARAIIDNFERDDVRADAIREFEEREEEDELDGLNSDELFTIASALLHEIDLAQDGVVVEKESGDLRAKAKRAMSAAIAARNRENANANRVTPRIPMRIVIPRATPRVPIFHDDAIERRAHDVGLRDVRVEPRPRLWHDEPAPATPPVARWAPDPENVHDSAVGDDVARRIALLRDADAHLFDQREVIGHVIGMMQEARVGPEKRAQIMRTLDMARTNSECARYRASELDILRLVAERAVRARNPEESRNIRDAVLTSLSECATPGGTVCLVGRISRYASALDAVDSSMPDTIHSVDAYRAEIMTGLGKLQTDSPNGVSAAQVNGFLEQYKDKLPAHSFEKIKSECVAAVE